MLVKDLLCSGYLEGIRVPTSPEVEVSLSPPEKRAALLPRGDYKGGRATTQVVVGQDQENFSDFGKGNPCTFGADLV